MAVYYGFRGLAAVAFSLRDLFNDWGRGVNGIWLIGENLSPWLFLISSKFYTLWIEFNDVAEGWLEFRGWVIANVTPSSALSQLSYWIDDLISLVRNFDDWVLYTLRRRAPELYDFISNPGAAIIGALTSSTGLSLSFLRDPRGTIIDLVHSVVGEIRDFTSNPAGFIVGALMSHFPNLTLILSDPDGWLISRLRQLSPELGDFLRDPDGFIFDRFVGMIERRIDEVSGLFVALATKILNAIW